MSELAAHGLGVSPPPGWEGRIFVRPQRGDSVVNAADGAAAPTGERTFPLVHLATIPIPAGVADYGNGVVEDLGPNDAMIVLKEFDPSEASTVLFATEGLPRTLDPAGFDEAVLLRTLRGQGGFQIFFRESGRAFCLYVVLGGFANRDELVPAVNSVLATLRIDAPGAIPPGGGPPPTSAAPETALGIVQSAPDLTTLRALVTIAGLEELLDGPGPLTLFAPTDAAFAAYPGTDARRADSALAAKTLMYHLVRAEIPALSVTAPTAVTTVEGQDLALAPGPSGGGDGLTADGIATVREQDVANGVVHVLDGVLVPPAEPPETTAPPDTSAPPGSAEAPSTPPAS